MIFPEMIISGADSSPLDGRMAAMASLVINKSYTIFGNSLKAVSGIFG